MLFSMNTVRHGHFMIILLKVMNVIIISVNRAVFPRTEPGLFWGIFELIENVWCRVAVNQYSISSWITLCRPVEGGWNLAGQLLVAPQKMWLQMHSFGRIKTCGGDWKMKQQVISVGWRHTDRRNNIKQPWSADCKRRCCFNILWFSGVDSLHEIRFLMSKVHIRYDSPIVPCLAAVFERIHVLFSICSWV
jgi:hypothetical protein